MSAPVGSGSRVLLRLSRAAFGYGGRPVVGGVDLALREDRWLGVLGPNGSGKTTLLRGLIGLLPPLEGRLERSGATMGYVPQRETLSALFPLTVEEVVRMGAYGRLSGLARLRFLPAREREAARSSLRRVGLEAFARERFSELSGGQRQRALIARALTSRPRILFLDEPTRGIDQRSLEDLLRVFEELRAEPGPTLVVVSHDEALVRSLVDDVARVADGTVRAEEPGGRSGGTGPQEPST